MKYKKLIFGVLFLALAIGLVPQVVGAAGLGSSIKGALKLTQDSAQLPAYTDPTAVVGIIIQGLLGIVAVVFFVLTVIAGIKWMMAGGNEETVAKSKQQILNGALGLIVVIFSYAITSIVFNIILNKD